MPFLGLTNHVSIHGLIRFDMPSDSPPPNSSLDLLLAETAKQTWVPSWQSSAGWLEEQSTTILQNLEPPTNQNPGHAMIDHYHVADFPSDGSLAKSIKPVQLYGRDNYMRFRSKVASANPGLRLEVVDTTSKLDEPAGKATVCVTCRLVNYTTR
ncbi:hypothetical protein M409DRAFT_20721 [Zasmidium cellare ATCC 36951]|uniref:Uncharacterized protein n=1 Tax=Zasmidium cellare ATCC 36951 TaxID=1080233 RepID=A0A6A6CNK3_ZASCE|nr:uncharacterized protein M409DRAFT_20721 [Zasmidium cellare ATCC 36951]KAF2168704.1 hypothetical protein M409DRAFT_20721 [Zasmidium cellare ATCC 36951]